MIHCQVIMITINALGIAFGGLTVTTVIGLGILISTVTVIEIGLSTNIAYHIQQEKSESTVKSPAVIAVKYFF